MNNCERIEGLGLMVVAYPEGLMALTYLEFLSLKIYDLRRKGVCQDGEEGNFFDETLLILDPVGGGLKFLIDGTLSEE